jgi:hypothetical protein
MEDNTIIPHYFSVENRGKVTMDSNLNSLSLRVGEVKEIVYPEDDLSLSKRWIEYTVEVVQRDGMKTHSSTLHHGCVVGQLFGGFADQVHYTLRKDEQKQGNDPDGGVGIGSKVLLLCINGTRSNPVIISGLPETDTDFGDKHKKDDGHNLYFEFNGVQFTINKDGEMKLMFRGATNTDGTLADSANSDAEGSYVSIDKDGNLKFATPKDDQFLTINHKDHKIEMQAQKEWDCTIKGTVNITADDNVVIKSSGVKVGDATDSWMLGSTYRQAEGQMNQEISGYLQSVETLLSTCATALMAAATANAVPMTGGAAAATPFNAAAAALEAAGPLIGQAATALTTFESSASTYLSTKNKND